MNMHFLDSKLSIVIPAYNEEGAVYETLKMLRTGFPNSEIILVDDGSTDATFTRASKIPGVIVARHLFNRGYGGSIKTGMSISTREYIAWFDADGEHQTSDLHGMLETIDRDRLVGVIGQRNRSASTPILRVVGKWLIKMTARSLQVKAGPDLNCGMRVFRLNLIRHYIPLLPDGYSASLTSTMIMIERGYPFAFYPVNIAPRIGSSKVKLIDGFLALVLVLRMIVLFAPLRIFFSSGFILLFIGLLYGIPLALIYGRGFPVGALFISFTGLLLCMLGLIADQVSQLRLSKHVPPVEYSLTETERTQMESPDASE